MNCKRSLPLVTATVMLSLAVVLPAWALMHSVPPAATVVHSDPANDPLTNARKGEPVNPIEARKGEPVNPIE